MFYFIIILGFWILCYAVLMLFAHKDVEEFAKESELIFNPKFVENYTKFLLFMGAPYWLILEIKSQYILWKALRKVKKVLKDVCDRNGIDYKTMMDKHNIKK